MVGNFRSKTWWTVCSRSRITRCGTTTSVYCGRCSVMHHELGRTVSSWMAHWVMHHELGRTISSWAAHWQRWWWSISTTAWWYHEGTSVWQSEHMYVVFKKFYKEKRLMWWEQWFSWMRPSTWSSSTGGKLQLMEYRSRFADRGPVFGGLWSYRSTV